MQHTEIKNGVQFTYHGTVYEIRDMNSPDSCERVDMFPAVEIARPGASPLWKPSPSGYQYFTRAQIITAIKESE
jgi:hypothetical protein